MAAKQDKLIVHVGDVFIKAGKVGSTWTVD